MNTDDLIVKLLSKLGINNDALWVKLLSRLSLEENTCGTGDNIVATTNQLHVATTNQLPVAYQAFSPAGQSYFTPQAPSYLQRMSAQVFCSPPVTPGYYYHPAHPLFAAQQQSLYGLKHALRAWFQRFASYVTRVGFQHSRYYYFSTSGVIYDRFSRTPIDTESKLGVDGDSVSDPTLYRSLAGSLQYLTFTRPDISYAVQHVFLHIHDPRVPHLSALKRILR
nr:retrotransposon protein, putative, unclassified [Tanacetum cinerariifolium]